MKILYRTLAVALLLLVAACGKPTKEELLGKSDNVKTKTELQAALGQPDDISKLGPIETWTYKASNGELIFVITGNTVQLQATSSRKEK